MEALLSHCVRASGEQIDPSLSPAPSVLCEDGRGTLYALGADGTVRASSAKDTSTPPRGAPWTRATPRRSPRTAGAIGRRRRRDVPAGPADRLRAAERCACPLPVASPRSAACGTARVLPPREGLGDERSPRAARWRWCACGRARRAVQTEATTQTTRGARASRFWRRRSRRTTPAACCARSGTPTPTGTWCFCSPTGRSASSTRRRMSRIPSRRTGWTPGAARRSLKSLRRTRCGRRSWTSRSRRRTAGARWRSSCSAERATCTRCVRSRPRARFPRVTLEAPLAVPGGARAVRGWRRRSRPRAPPRASGRQGAGLSTGDESGDEPQTPAAATRTTTAGPDRGGGGASATTTGVRAGRRDARARRCRGVFPSRGRTSRPPPGPLPLGTDPWRATATPAAAGRAGRCGAVPRGGAVRCGRRRGRAAGGGAPARGSGGVSATLDVLILPQEPSPGWARVETRPRAREATRGGGGPLTTYAYGYLDDDDDDADTIALTPPVDDEDEGALPPLLAIDRVRLVATRDDGGGGVAGEGASGRSRAAAAERLAPFVSAAFDPGCRERVFCCAGAPCTPSAHLAREWRAPWTARTRGRRRCARRV